MTALEKDAAVRRIMSAFIAILSVLALCIQTIPETMTMRMASHRIPTQAAQITQGKSQVAQKSQQGRQVLEIREELDLEIDSDLRKLPPRCHI
jgi:hypothetical protein